MKPQKGIALENSVLACRESVLVTADMSLKAGFVVHPEKSVLEPTQKITYLGFWLSSTDMTVKLTDQNASFGLLIKATTTRHL